MLQQTVPGATCGCAEAVLACDGRGIAFGGLTNPDDTVILGALTIPLPPERLPNAGQMGVYVRVRGFAAPLVVLIAHTPDRRPPRLTFFGFYALGDFEESVGFGARDDGLPLTGVESKPFSWARPEDKPEAILIAPVELVGGEAFHLSEVDCVIPFFIPADPPW